MASRGPITPFSPNPRASASPIRWTRMPAESGASRVGVARRPQVFGRPISPRVSTGEASMPAAFSIAATRSSPATSMACSQS